MKNIRQIQAVNKILEGKKQQFIFDLTKINSFIEKKIINIKKFKEYQQEYTNENFLKLSKMTPLLHKNLESFLKKIKDIILKEEHEMERLEIQKKSLLDEIEKVNSRIDLMNKFEDNAVVEINLKLDKQEQARMDDLVANKKARSEYE